MSVKFQDVKIGCRFLYKGVVYVKSSSRTSRINKRKFKYFANNDEVKMLSLDLD